MQAPRGLWTGWGRGSPPTEVQDGVGGEHAQDDEGSGNGHSHVLGGVGPEHIWIHSSSESQEATDAYEQMQGEREGEGGLPTPDGSVGAAWEVRADAPLPASAGVACRSPAAHAGAFCTCLPNFHTNRCICANHCAATTPLGSQLRCPLLREHCPARAVTPTPVTCFPSCSVLFRSPLSKSPVTSQNRGPMARGTLPVCLLCFLW